MLILYQIKLLIQNQIKHILNIALYYIIWSFITSHHIIRRPIVRNGDLKVYLSKWKGNILTFLKLMVQKTYDMCLSQIEDFIFGIAAKKENNK